MPILNSPYNCESLLRIDDKGLTNQICSNLNCHPLKWILVSCIYSDRQKQILKVYGHGNLREFLKVS